MKTIFLFFLCTLFFLSATLARAKTFQVQNRSVHLHLPSSPPKGEKIGAVILLHGYGTNSWQQNLYLQFSRQVKNLHLAAVLLDGTKDKKGKRFWNAGHPSCCNFHQSSVDDVAFLEEVIAELITNHGIHEKKIYLFGHSNGGFMSYEMLCRSKVDLAGIAVLAGSYYENIEHCPLKETSILHLHGTKDDDILYKGRKEEYPDPLTLHKKWAQKFGCLISEIKEKAHNLVFFGGDETDEFFFKDCHFPSQKVAHWRMKGVGHLPFHKLNLVKKAMEFLKKK